MALKRRTAGTDAFGHCSSDNKESIAHSFWAGLLPRGYEAYGYTQGLCISPPGEGNKEQEAEAAAAGFPVMVWEWLGRPNDLGRMGNTQQAEGTVVFCSLFGIHYLLRGQEVSQTDSIILCSDFQYAGWAMQLELAAESKGDTC